MSEHADQGDDGDVQGRPAAEWITLGLSIAVVALVVGLASWLYLRSDDEPPIIVVETMLDDVRQADGDWYLPIEIRNEGDRTVANAIVQGELDTGDGDPQVAEITITYLAEGERTGATFVFADSPSSGTLTIRVTSYTDP